MRNLPATPFFLETETGNRFCLYHSLPSNVSCKGTFIYIPPFGEEMNKARRMAALQARAFNRIGYDVLQIDLFGCGDSSGEFREARWDIWKQDIAFAVNWLKERSTAPINLWGCRLGALLALDFAGSVVYHINNILLWQPILNGQSFLTQFLRLELASKIFSPDSQEINSVSLLRNTLANGKVLEIAGYELSPELTGAIDRLKINDFNPTNHAIHWIEVVADINRPISSAKINIMGKWKKGGNTVEITQVSCLPFWVTQEISECQNLISITTDLFTDQSEHVD